MRRLPDYRVQLGESRPGVDEIGIIESLRERLVEPPQQRR
jgi:hypothetical protein